MRRFLPFLLLPACQDPCEKGMDRLTAAYESCDLAYTAPATTPECTDAQADATDCTATCVESVACEGLDGSDLTEAQALTDCLVACAQDTGIE